MAQLSRAQLATLIGTKIADNAAGGITPADLREVLEAVKDSSRWYDETPGPAGLNGFSCSGVQEVTTGPYSIGLADDGKLLLAISGSAIEFALPLDSQADLRVGATVHVMWVNDYAQPAFVAGGGITFDVHEWTVAKPHPEGNVATVFKVGPDHWKLVGMCEPSVAGIAAFRPVDSYSAGFTFGDSDVRSHIEVNAADPVTVTLPADATNDLPEASEAFIIQAGAGKVTISAEAGVTLLHRADKAPETAAQHAEIRVVKVAADTWRLTGDLADAPV